MKTTLELPDDLMRAVKIRAINEDRSLKEMMAEIVRRGLAQESPAEGAGPRRVRVPLVECAHEARPGEEMTPARVAEVLSGEDASGVLDRP